MLCLIDNYDSFTYNIVSYLNQLGVQPWIVKNDAMTLDQLASHDIEGILISPGPCTPSQSGITLEVIKAYAGKVPILGICLGHEAIAEAFGGYIEHAREVMHGKVSHVHHDGRGVFTGVSQPVRVTRYHSLIVTRQRMPADFEISAWTCDAQGNIEDVMGIRHRDLDIEGVQFHPESILTEHGHLMLANFLRRLDQHRPSLGKAAGF
ncbi:MULTISPECIES: anthranilate synthase component II [Chromohalobacter]|uniref:Aminodeoxychorismate/anthranilate synthase component II n=1 Tax=Chromohalobacter canadensis TaxID=141389 RepID=A0ABZ0YF39_9GAMM|nr:MULTISPECIES: aminodeoxychorismate/anthranilate synthase component II [Chromohalobacter]MCK0767539.1 aminodeoxychorismate/anthranilate synthase component II [Chromohalobacter canadensis]MCT8468609.1 aminodeoxychorismate/anthranilate synthase component II [Chromohalobacter canadensis]MCT8471664.1 aminodeoxychorismate/anthranilate synthase component II [Chromohalobacter canadensis]MCT8499117.1 aminodeoxychorismate/anthranilate synthase component II [Chromohalobacter canadensis]MDV6317640.1 am